MDVHVPPYQQNVYLLLGASELVFLIARATKYSTLSLQGILQSKFQLDQMRPGQPVRQIFLFGHLHLLHTSCAVAPLEALAMLWQKEISRSLLLGAGHQAVSNGTR